MNPAGALVLAFNEEANIARCLRSLSAFPRVVVLDSGSTDRTVAIAGGFPNAEVLHRPFDDFAGQRNHGLAAAFAPDDWVLNLDADEELTPRLLRAIRRLEPRPGERAFNLAGLVHLRGRPVPRASGFPVYQTRLVRGDFRFVQVGHGQKAPACEGPIRALSAPYRHHPFDKGLSDWLARHDRYALQEARAFLDQEGGMGWRDWRRAAADPIARRQLAKALSMRLPFAPEAVAAYLLLVRGGWLDGAAGREYCRLRWLYEGWVRLRLAEEEARRAG